MTSATCGDLSPIPALVRTRPSASVVPPARYSTRRSGPLGLKAAAHQALARAGRHVNPRVTLAVALRSAGAGGVCRLAVVLAGLRDSVALLGLELRLRRRTALGQRHEGHRQGRSYGRSDEEVGLSHVDSPFVSAGLDAWSDLASPPSPLRLSPRAQGDRGVNPKDTRSG